MQTRRSNIVPAKMSEEERAKLKDDDVLTAGKAARFLGITVDQLRHYRRLEQIHGEKITDHETLFKVADLRNANIQPGKRGPKPKAKSIDKLTDIC